MSTRQSIPDLAYAVAITAIDGIGPQSMHRLMGHFDAAQAAWESDYEGLSKTLTERQIQTFVRQRSTLNPAKLWDQIQRLSIAVVDWRHQHYPRLLKEISDPPYLLYVRGSVELLSSTCFSVVGTRRATRYGSAACNHIIPSLASHGLTIVSGLALGIDTLAHEAALTTGTTIAVLAHGLDQIHPTSNVGLAQKILKKQGALVSEYPPGILPERGRFPQRNRIIAGLSRQTLVIEAPERSGALITAHLALDENREVLAVPGPIFSLTSAGTNKLIKAGATVVTGPDDILGSAASPIPTAPAIQLSPLAKTICAHLTGDAQHIDNIAAACNLDPSIVGAELAHLEIAGVVMNLGGQRYQRIG